MRVISQDGSLDYPYENSVVFFDTIHYGENAVVAQIIGDTEIAMLGKYSTKEKAIKAMEMLREHYKRLETLKLYTKGSREDIREMLTLDELGCTILKTRKLSVFQFPQDDEIEV